jgi:hypothetical protein
MDIVIDIIISLKSLNLIIIHINTDEFINDFETIFRTKLSSRIPNYHNLKLYINADISDDFYKNKIALQYGYCEC